MRYANVGPDYLVTSVVESDNALGAPWVLCGPEVGPGLKFHQGAFVQASLAPQVPSYVTRFQAIAALHLSGLLHDVEAYMSQESTPELTKLAWQNAASFERQSPTVLELASLLGLNSEQLDQLFISAKEIAA